MEELEEESLKMTTNFLNYMDNPQTLDSYILSDNAIFDWFGRSVFGRNSIHNFIRTHIPKMYHTVESISKIEPINHRALRIKNIDKVKHINEPSQGVVEVSEPELGQGDCKRNTTPVNQNRVDLDELLKAPKKRRGQRSHSDATHWQFVEVKGKLELDGNSRADKKLQKLFLGFTDQIHLIVYEGRSNCRKKLAPLFSVADE